MQLSRLFNPRHWPRWAAEALSVVEARTHASGFIATGSKSGVSYIPLPERVWATKSFEFWVFLSALLNRVRPESLLEIGSGRSTIYLSEYASKEDKQYISIDENARWAALNNAIARFGSLESGYVNHVPLEADGFFNERALRDLLPTEPEFLFLDGPIGSRNSPRQVSLYRELARTARLVIVDDIQFPTIYPQVELFEREGSLRTVAYFQYRANKRYYNYLAVLCEPRIAKLVEKLQSCLDISALHSVSEEICIDKKTGQCVPPVPLPG